MNLKKLMSKSGFYILSTLVLAQANVAFSADEDLELGIVEMTAKPAKDPEKSSRSLEVSDGDEHSDSNKFSALHDRLEQLKSIINDNINSMLTNVNTAEEVESSASELSTQAEVFRKNTKKVKRKMKYKHLVASGTCLGVVVAIVAGIVIYRHFHDDSEGSIEVV